MLYNATNMFVTVHGGYLKPRGLGFADWQSEIAHTIYFIFFSGRG